MLENTNITGVNITMIESSGAYSADIIRLSNVTFTNMTVKNNSVDSILVIERELHPFHC